MSGGRLVVLDRLGRDVKAYPLSEGLATIGSGAACDIRVLLPTVSPHHATVVVHPNQTVVSSITAGETLVNGVGVSVCVLRHGDRLGVGGRTLRWEYDQPHMRPALPGSPGASARKRARGRRRSPLAPQRASVPPSSAKQVAIVQPQRRHTTNDQNESPQPSSSASSNRSRSSRNSDAPEDVDTTNRKSAARASPKNVSLSDSTKASLWIESRKTPRALPRVLPRALPRSAPRAARKSTPLRLAVLRKAQSAHKLRVTKIQAPSKIDHTKQAAIMLMTGHTPKPKPTPKRPSFVVKKPSPVRGKTLGGNVSGVTPKRVSPRAAARSSEGTGDKSVSDLQSPIMPKPRKSALKKSSKKSTRRTESIKFDLSNLENPEDRPSDVVLLEDATKDCGDDFVSEEDISLRYSDSSRSPSPKRSIQSRSSRILERSIGETYVQNLSSDRSANLDSPRSKKSSNQSVLDSPRQRKSSRGSLILEKALESSFEISPVSPSSRRTTKSMTDQSYSTTFASTRKTMTRSPRSNNQNLESYSIVDLVSMDSIGSDRSVYGSAGSETSTTFATPRPGRSTRANNSSLLSSSTPYAETKQSSKTVSPVSLRSRTTSPQVSIKSKNSTLSKRRSASLTTPENTQTRLTINSTRISRASRSRSRINDSDILLMDDDEASPKSSRRISKSSLSSPIPRKTITITDTPESVHNGTSTPENTNSPEEATTPVLSIQNFLEQSSLSQSSLSSQRSQSRRGANFKRKTIGGDCPETKKPRSSFKSRSLVATSRRSLRVTTSSVDHMDLSLNSSNDIYQDEEVTTPKSAVLPIPEGVKNKHSTAKKTQSKRSIIDNLDESDFVKQLFNSPVKRKLSQSMTEFSRKKLFEDDDDVRRPTRNTIALTGRTPDNSFMERTENFTPDVFVSPMSTPGKSPNTTGLERQFDNTPESNRRNVRGNNSLLTRRSIKNDLTDVAGVKRVFGRSPKNRLSDVSVKEVFAPSPKNDLRRVTGVKTLFLSARKQKSPKNTLEDVRGVKELFRNKKSVSNDLRNISGVKSALRVNSPRNDLSDVRGLRRLYRESPKNNLSDVSGVEELFNISQDSQDSSFDDLIGHTHENQDLNTTFDQLLGKPTLRAYTKPRSFTKVVKPKQKRNAKSLNDSISMITENVEEWLQNELKKRVNKEKSTNKSNLTRELQKLTTDTVEGSAPIILSRSRNSTMTRSVNAENQERKKSASEIYSIHTLPIKKRSLVETNKRSQLEVLPLKKRRVVHSTPVKGRVSVTMNASELGRVSPIANVTAVGKIDGLLHRELSKMTRTKITLTDDLSFEMATTKVLVPEMAQKKLSPKRVSPKKPSQKQVRASTRSNRRGSLVITKKKPILSPKPIIEKPKTPTNDGKVMPTRNRPVRQIKVDKKLKTKKNTRAKRATATEPENQVLQSEAESEEEKVEKITKGKSINKEPPKTPKNTRARAIKMTVVVTKPSPQLKPKRNLNSKVNDPKFTKSEARTRQRKQDIENIPDLTIEQKQSRRTRNAKNVTDAKPTKEKPKAKTVKESITKVQDVKSKPNNRGKHVTFEAEPPTEATATRVGASKSVITEDIKVNSTRRRNVKDIIETATFILKTRKRLSKISVTEKNTEPTIDEVGIKTRRGAKSKNVTFKEEIPPNKRGKSVQSQNDSKLTRSKKSAEDTVKTGKNIAKDTVQAGKKSTAPVITDKEEGPKRGNTKSEEKTEIESARRTTRKAQSENTIAVQNVQEDNKEKAVGRRTRKATISKSEEIVKEDKNNIPENKKEVVAGKKIRNVQKSNAKGKGDEKEVLEDKMEVETSSRGRRNKNVTQEVPVENAKGKKTTAPEKEAPKRGVRTKKAELEVPGVKDVQPGEVAKPARRKRKVDVNETTIKEAPAKRLRTTRAAAATLVEPVVQSGRSRRR